jgi:hypothetical protein
MGCDYGALRVAFSFPALRPRRATHPWLCKCVAASNISVTNGWGHMSARYIGAVAAAFLYALPATAADVRVAPSDYIVLNPVNPDKGWSDILIHTIGIATGPNETLTLDGMTVEVMSQGRAVLTRAVTPDEMISTSKDMASAPIPEFVEGQVLSADGVNGFFGRQVSFATSATLAPSQALLFTRLHFSIGFPADSVRVLARLHGRDGKSVLAIATIPVHAYKPVISYHSPLSGEWLMQAIPTEESHHRFNPSTEFAVDFFKLGPDNEKTFGNSLDVNDHYGYGDPVEAAADGTVVAVIADQVQDRQALLPKPGESDDSFYARVGQYHMQQMQKNFHAANAGNLVTIRHEANGVVEYSSYGHLKAGSVRVKLGDVVRQGQIIAQVGDTGDAAAVHLHFQINAGSDAFTSKSLPAILTDQTNISGDLGYIITAPQ